MNIAAIDIGGTDIKYALVSESDTSHNIVVKKSPTPSTGGEKIVAYVGDLAESLGHFEAIALCTAGQVNPVTGEIIYANENIPGYTGTKVKAILRERFGCPVEVRNDVNAAALGEGIYGAAKGVSDYLCLTYGTGVGGAIVVGGKVYEGATFSAGEFGHIVTHTDGEPCVCGGYGCYERYASTGALLRLVEKRCGLNINGFEIFAAMGENAAVAKAVDIWVHEIVIGLMPLCHIFNPARIVLAGGIMNEDTLVDSIRRELKAGIMKSFASVEVMQAELGSSAGLLGAVAALQQSLEGTR